MRGVISVTVLVGLINTTISLRPQPRDHKSPTFDVASVKPNTSADDNVAMKLQAAKARAEFLVIDHVDKPSSD